MEFEWEDLICEMNSELDTPSSSEELQPRKKSSKLRYRSRCASFRKKRESTDIVPFGGLQRRHSLDSLESSGDSICGELEKIADNKSRKRSEGGLQENILSVSPRAKKLSRLSGIFSREEITINTNSNNDIQLRKKSPKLKGIKRRLSRSTSREKMEKPTLFSAKYSFNNAENEFGFDPRITKQITLYYTSQQLPDDFPMSILECLYSRIGTVDGVQKLLAQRGWEFKVAKDEKQNTDQLHTNVSNNSPSYYFGTWSYDCWSVFEGSPAGSYITCHKQNRYYLMHKTKDGKLVLDVMKKGPRVSSALSKKFSLTKGLPRPNQRYVCAKCSKNTPCDLLEPEDGHESVLSKFVLSYPVQFTHNVDNM